MAFVKKLIDVYRLNQTRLMLVQDSNDPEQAVPLTTAMLGGGGGGGSDPASAREVTLAELLQLAKSSGLRVEDKAITTTLPPQALTVNASVSSLAVPPGATHATVHVVTGSVRRSIGGAPSGSTPALNAGDSEEISGAELTAYRLVRSGDADAQVSVEYRVVG